MNHDPYERQQPVSISLCPSGCIRMQFGMAMIHLTPGDFRAFTTLFLQALPEIEARCEAAVPPQARARA